LSAFNPTLIDALAPPAANSDLVVDLTVHAIDQPGILSGLTKPISGHGASIGAVSFGLYAGENPPHGSGLFVVEMNLLVRDFIASRHIESELLDLERENNWEIDYRPAKLARIESVDDKEEEG
jgi:hypothetical protein